MIAKTKFRPKGKNKDSYVELVLDFPLASTNTGGHLDSTRRAINILLASEKLNE